MRYPQLCSSTGWGSYVIDRSRGEPLRPEEWFETTWVFDVPAEVN